MAPDDDNVDTGLSEIIVPLTRTDIFNKSLEIQQSDALFSRSTA